MVSLSKSTTAPFVTFTQKGTGSSGGTSVNLAGSTSGGETIVVGNGVSGTGVAPGTTVAAIVGSTLTLSKATTSAVTNTKALVFTGTDATFTSLVYDFGNSDTAAAELLVGQSVSGSNVAFGTTVTSVDTVEIGRAHV